MSSKILSALLNEKINHFEDSFSRTATEVYFDSENKLIHPLEFGLYRESVSKDFLKFIIPSKYQIDDGFIINANDKISTQCDIVIVDGNHTPLFESGKKQRFFPMETVVSVGEIKSTLSKHQFKTALNNLAKTKSIRREIQNPEILTRHNQLPPFNQYDHACDQIITFLICKNLDFDISTINFDEFYNLDVDSRDRHNMILSIDDGLFIYELFINGRLAFVPFPVSNGNILKTRIVKPGKDKRNHYYNFANSFNNNINLSTIFYPSFRNYLEYNFIEFFD